jgi:hypothetical protein
MGKIAGSFEAATGGARFRLYLAATSRRLKTVLLGPSQNCLDVRLHSVTSVVERTIRSDRALAQSETVLPSRQAS